MEMHAAVMMEKRATILCAEDTDSERFCGQMDDSQVKVWLDIMRNVCNARLDPVPDLC
jgi:hypothetical protein